MAGITQGRPELAVGEPIRLGNNDEFEIEQHPVSDRLIIRDTVNGKVAYVRKERGGQVGGDGVLIKALKEGKPMADDGRTYDTIQQAESQASSWVFVPPGTFNESVTIDTDGLTLCGSGYNTLVDGGTSGDAIRSEADNVTVKDISVATTNNGNENNTALALVGGNAVANNVTVRSADHQGIGFAGGAVVNCTIDNAYTNGITGASIAVGNTVTNSGDIAGIRVQNDSVVANNVVIDSTKTGIGAIVGGDDSILIGNRVINSGDDGILLYNSNDVIVANNRVSDSTNADIDDQGTGTLLDANLTGASN